MRDLRVARPRRGLSWLAIVVAVAGLLALSRVAVAVAYAGRIYPGVQVLGASLGGQTVDEAAATLRARLEPYRREPVVVQAGDQQLRLTPDDLGFRADALALARDAYGVGRSGSVLARIVAPAVAFRLAPEDLANPSVVDDAAVEAAVQRIAAAADRPSVDAALTLAPRLVLTPSRTGQRLDEPLAREAIRRYLSEFASGPLALPVSIEQPRLTTEHLEPVRAQAEAILGRTVVLVDGQRQWPVPGDAVRASLALRADPVGLEVRPEAFGSLVANVARDVDRPAADATLTIAGGKAQLSPEQPGRAVDQRATAAVLAERLLAGASSVAVVVRAVDPAVKAGDLKPVAIEAEKAIGRGLVLTGAGQSYRVSPVEMGDLLVVRQASPGRWEVALDERRVEQLVQRVNDRLKHPSLDARFGWENGRLKLPGPSVPAVVVDQPRAVRKVLDAWRGGEVDLPMADGQMELDPAYVERLNQDLKGIIEERSISFAGSIPERAHNIGLALSKINGVLVSPGQTFSFNRVLGPPTLEAGFQWGFAYSTQQGTSQVVPSVAGGICQVSTTVFQPVFWAGYQIEERHWHMFAMKHYADRGYVGLDATVFPEQGLDFRFTNNTDHALLILAGTRDNATYVALIGTKPDWTVKVDPEVITGVTPAPKEVVRTTSPLFARGREIVLESAQEGLTSHVTRHVIYPDGHERTLSMTSDYQPAPTSILVGTG